VPGMQCTKFWSLKQIAVGVFELRMLCGFVQETQVSVAGSKEAERHSLTNTSVAELEPEPQGAASFGQSQSWSRNVMRLRLRRL
jgi:hypothetical protein